MELDHKSTSAGVAVEFLIQEFHLLASVLRRGVESFHGARYSSRSLDSSAEAERGRLNVVTGVESSSDFTSCIIAFFAPFSLFIGTFRIRVSVEELKQLFGCCSSLGLDMGRV